MRTLTIGNIKVRLPIIQGGMGVGISLSGLAASVANQGGIGVIAAAGVGMNEPDYYKHFRESNIRALKEQIQKARELTNGIIGVNIMVALSDFSDMVKAAIEEKIDIIFSGAGLPLDLPKFLNGSKSTKLVPIVSSGKAARIIASRWFKRYNYTPDAIVVEGPKAGGHLGFKPEQLDDPEFALEKLVKDVLNDIKPIEELAGKKIPVIAAGGIYTGKDIYDIMKLGVAGVQMGTRFVNTVECDASDAFKNCYIAAQKEDITVINSPVGMPGRAIINDFIKSTLAGEKKPYKCPYHCIVSCDYLDSPYCIALALSNAKRGKMKSGFAFAGANAYKAESIISVEKLVEDLIDEYDKSL